MKVWIHCPSDQLPLLTECAADAILEEVLFPFSIRQGFDLRKYQAYLYYTGLPLNLSDSVASLQLEEIALIEFGVEPSSWPTLTGAYVITRSEAVAVLSDHQEDVYLIRPSESSSNYVLSLRHKGHIRHFQLHAVVGVNGPEYFLGSQRFGRLSQLVKFHHVHPISCGDAHTRIHITLGRPLDDIDLQRFLSRQSSKSLPLRIRPSLSPTRPAPTTPRSASLHANTKPLQPRSTSLHAGTSVPRRASRPPPRVPSRDSDTPNNHRYQYADNSPVPSPKRLQSESPAHQRRNNSRRMRREWEMIGDAEHGQVYFNCLTRATVYSKPDDYPGDYIVRNKANQYVRVARDKAEAFLRKSMSSRAKFCSPANSRRSSSPPAPEAPLRCPTLRNSTLAADQENQAPDVADINPLSTADDKDNTSAGPMTGANVPPAPSAADLKESVPSLNQFQQNSSNSSLQDALRAVKLRRAVERNPESKPLIGPTGGSAIALALHRVLAQRRVALGDDEDGCEDSDDDEWAVESVEAF
eukprot:TRINITY_DN7988_c0_g2_i2.p1 TRINITY_DN7988_c0_g2~~TRINITY_DN7988_c0_g2_i2.p1  ORF type:complete len:525 (+),score=62.09 TRINITY_DN7988_c0_g2_i2:75-1649(+)